ncbi:MAG: hypothetical protein FJX67_14665 [Alphaproteobacteria bacterium]|nr:hypothetical protein [Alphaproteobacteria bacterium]
MTTEKPAAGPGPFTAHAYGAAFLPRLFRLAGAYWSSQERWKVRALTLALVLCVLTQVMIAIWTNLWFADFFDALE